MQRGIVPELIVLFLHEKGNVPAADSVELRSRRGLTKWDLSWKAVKLWEVPAEELLAMGDVGLIPWLILDKLKQAGVEGKLVVKRCFIRLARSAQGHDDHR